MPSPNSLKDKILAKISPKDKVILGLSGGPDSVFLFHFLNESLPKNQLITCHVNYGLRGKDSKKDQVFTEKLCKKHDIQLYVKTASNSIHKGNLENNCRKLRYDFFEKIRAQENAKFIIVAHHLNDQIETFFLNIVRGSSLKGFLGMQETDSERNLWRPILDWQKEDIINWLKKRKHKYRIDKSNFSKKFTRNIIRHEIIPAFEGINPNFINTTKNTLNDLKESLGIVEKITENWIKNNFHKKTFELDNFLKEPKIIQKHIIRELFKKTNNKSLTTHTAKEILQTLTKNRAGLQKEFGKSTKLIIFKDNKKNKRIVVIEHEVD